MGMTVTGMPALNAIRSVVDAPPGIVTSADLPASLLAGRFAESVAAAAAVGPGGAEAPTVAGRHLPGGARRLVQPSARRPRRRRGRPLETLGTELVAFRTEDGAAHVFDAHCPHPRRQPGHGGGARAAWVPVPRWTFAGDGIGRRGAPARSPAAAGLRPGPGRCVRPTAVLVWYHAGGEPPSLPLVRTYRDTTAPSGRPGRSTLPGAGSRSRTRD